MLKVLKVGKECVQRHLRISDPICVLRNEIHSSASRFGRRTGSKALEPDPRSFSKKQKRRKRLAAGYSEERINIKTEKLKEKAFLKQAQSPQLEEYVKDLEDGLSDSLRKLMLPDSLNTSSRKDNKATFGVNPYRVLKSLRVQAGLSSNGWSSSTTELALGLQENNNLLSRVSVEESQNALTVLSRQGRLHDAEELFSLMRKSHFPINDRSFTDLMIAANRSKQYQVTEKYFNEILNNNLEPGEDAWAALVDSKSKLGDINGAINIIDRLIKSGVKLKDPCVIYTSVLKSFVDSKRYDDAYDFWLRMHDEGIKLNLRAFHVMLQQCYLTKQTERAFFYLDEMKVLGIEPNNKIFAGLFRACAEAPQWVNGYQNIIFDAMDRMEGAELVPNTEVYNSIIYAFSKVGDANAAEFYFWEMRKKGIKQDIITYNSLLAAYSRSQAVGAREFGLLGRFVRKPTIPTKEEKIAMTLGSERVAEVLSEDVMQDHIEEPGKRTRLGPLTDLADDDDILEDKWRMLAQEAREVEGRQRGGGRGPGEGRSGRGSLRQRGQRQLVSRISDDEDAPDEDEGDSWDKARSDVPDEDEEGEVPSSIEEWEGFEEEDDETVAEELRMLANKDEVGLEMSDEEFHRLFDSLPEEDKISMEDLLKEIKADGLNLMKKKDKKEGGTKFKGRRGSRDVVDREQAQPSELLPSQQASSGSSSSGEARKARRARVTAWRPGKRGGRQEVNTPDLEPQISSDVIESDEESPLSPISTSSRTPTIEFDKNAPSFLRKAVTGSSGAENYPLIRPNALKSRSIMSSESLSSERILEDLVSALDPQGDVRKGNSLRASSSARSVLKLNSRQLKSLVTDENKEDEFGDEDMDKMWDLVTFGRAPDFDYTTHWRERQEQNILSAEMALKEIKDQGMPIDSRTMTAYLGVYAEALKDDDALRIFNSFEESGLSHSVHSYRCMMRMYVRMKHLNAALALKEDMIKKHIQPDEMIYGMLIETLSHRNMIVESLKELEEAHDKGIKIADKHIRLLRGRCRNLGISHPNIPEDPNQWVKDVKETRRRHKGDSERKISQIRGHLFT